MIALHWLFCDLAMIDTVDFGCGRISATEYYGEAFGGGEGRGFWTYSGCGRFNSEGSGNNFFPHLNQINKEKGDGTGIGEWWQDDLKFPKQKSKSLLHMGPKKTGPVRPYSPGGP